MASQPHSGRQAPATHPLEVSRRYDADVWKLHTPYPLRHLAPHPFKLPYEEVLADIAEHGIQEPLLIDWTHMVICGHKRLQAALDLGLASVPVHVVHNITARERFLIATGLPNDSELAYTGFAEKLAAVQVKAAPEPDPVVAAADGAGTAEETAVDTTIETAANQEAGTVELEPVHPLTVSSVRAADPRTLQPLWPHRRDRWCAVTFAALVEDVRKHGIREALLVNLAGKVLSGHMRLQAALDLGLASVAVHVVSNITAREGRMINVGPVDGPALQYTGLAEKLAMVHGVVPVLLPEATAPLVDEVHEEAVPRPPAPAPAASVAGRRFLRNARAAVRAGQRMDFFGFGAAPAGACGAVRRKTRMWRTLVFGARDPPRGRARPRGPCDWLVLAESARNASRVKYRGTRALPTVLAR